VAGGLRLLCRRLKFGRIYLTMGLAEDIVAEGFRLVLLPD